MVTPQQPSRPSTISLSPATVALAAIGRTARLAAQVHDQRGDAMTGVALIWSSSDDVVATVDTAGLVSAAGAGTATITARAGDVGGTAQVTVAQQDRAALVALYERTNGPEWVDNEHWLTDEPLDRWHGVDTDSAGRVTRVDLGSRRDGENQGWESQGLEGYIPPEIADLDQLRSLNLVGNSLSGPIPPELGRLENLVDLELGVNRLSGPIPPELGRLTSLETLWLNYNGGLSGPIPPELGRMENLETLAVAGNQLEGVVPPELGGLTRLEELDLGANRLSGPIPGALGGLTRLRVLILNFNRFTGPLPVELVALNRLNAFLFDENDGLCAPGTSAFVAWMENLEWMENLGAGYESGFCNARDVRSLADFFRAAGGTDWVGSDNWLANPALGTWHGVDADSLGRVVALDLAGNGLAGRLSPSLSGLTRLKKLTVDDNALEGRLPLGLVALSLETLHYAGTRLCAPTEPAFAKWLRDVASHRGTGLACAPLSDREALAALYGTTAGATWEAADNWLTDAPLGEWHGVETNDAGNVTHLTLRSNDLSGPIPPELGGLSSLRSLDLSENELTGSVPPWLADLVRLDSLFLHENDLTGPVPVELGRMSNLKALALHGNELVGRIPPELGGLASMERLSLFGNELSGPIPPELGRLVNLEELYLPENDLSGPIPPELGRLASLEQLYLDMNDLSGPVPSELGELASLKVLSLTGNPSMAGALPASFVRLGDLEELMTVGTDLCMPADSAFQAWLETVHKRRVEPCVRTDPPAAYLVQAVQSRAFPVPLVAGEQALLRVFPTATHATTEGLPKARARFFVADREVHEEDIPGTSVPIPTEVDESSLAASLNAAIPGRVVQPGLEMVVDVDPDGTLDSSLGVAKRIPAMGRLAVAVRTMPPLDLTLIPFVWTETHDSAVVRTVAAVVDDPESHDLLEPTRMLLPVGELDVKGHEPVISSSNDAFDVLLRTRAIRALEGGEGRYMGWMSEPVEGASGVAHPSRLESMSIPDAAVIGHELGHNMNLQHAPCGVSGEPSYPYPDGSIGAWGYDFRGSGALISPSRPDLMSYCLDSYWIGDYHFTNALRYRSFAESGGVVAGSAPSILLWGGVTADGVPFLEPSFVVDAPALLPDSVGQYRVRAHGPDRRELFSIRFALTDVWDGDGGAVFAYVLPLESEWRDSIAGITLSGPEGTATMGPNSARSMAIWRDADGGRIRGFLTGADLETAMRAFRPTGDPTRGDGRTSPGVLSSRGIPDAWSWRR